MEGYLIESDRILKIEDDLRAIKNLLSVRESIRLNTHWYTLKETSIVLGVCMKSLYNYMKSGILPHSNFAGKVYIKQSDINDIFEKNYTGKNQTDDVV